MTYWGLGRRIIAGWVILLGSGVIIIFSYRGTSRGILALLLILSGLLLFGCRTVRFPSQSSRREEVLSLNSEGIAAFERREYDLAEKQFAEAVKIDENDLVSQRYYAETLWVRGEKKEAVRILAEISQKGGSAEEQTAINRSIAEKLLGAGQPVSALRYAERVIQYSPQRADGWALRGNVYWQLGKMNEALSDYHRALHLAPDDRNILWQLAILNEQAGYYDRSLAAWQQLGRLTSEDAEPVEVLCGKALAYRRLRKFEESARCYETALARFPEQAEIYPLLADLYIETKRLDLAVNLAQEAQRRFPVNGAIREMTGKVEKVWMASLPAAVPH